jgi:hypothetical protein
MSYNKTDEYNNGYNKGDGYNKVVDGYSKWHNNKNNIITELDAELSDEIKKNMPSNYGNKWSDEERKKMIKMLKNGDDVIIIADKLNRSEGGIKGEIKKIVYSKYIDGIDAEIISKELNIIYKNVKSIIKVCIEQDCDNNITNLEKENKFLRLKIDNIRLRKKIASMNKNS